MEQNYITFIKALVEYDTQIEMYSDRIYFAKALLMIESNEEKIKELKDEIESNRKKMNELKEKRDRLFTEKMQGENEKPGNNISRGAGRDEETGDER